MATSRPTRSQEVWCEYGSVAINEADEQWIVVLELCEGPVARVCTGRAHLDRIHISLKTRDDPPRNFVIIFRLLVGVFPDRILPTKFFHLGLKGLRAGDGRMEYLWCSTQSLRCACICLLRTGLLAEESLPTRNRFKSTSCLPMTTRRSPSLERTRGRRFLFFIHNLMIEKVCANVKRASVCVE